MNAILDKYGRTFKTLRVSLTNTCNLACSYCVDPINTKQKLTHSDFTKKALTNIEYIQIIQSLHRILDIKTVRLTGGEPTLYKELIPLIKEIKNLGIENIKMTSNGSLIENKAVELKNAGLTSVNISLDAIDDAISLDISKRKKIKSTLSGIENAIRAGLIVKINSVVMKGVNENQILKLFEFSKKRDITIRFLELMQMGHLYHNFKQYFFSENEILRTISAEYKIQPLDRANNATAKYWITEDGYRFGIISNESNPFCNDCNRLRLDSYGNIYGCLSDNHPIPIKDCLDSEQEIKNKLLEALAQKKTKFSGSPLTMLHIGG